MGIPRLSSLYTLPRAILNNALSLRLTAIAGTLILPEILWDISLYLIPYLIRKCYHFLYIEGQRPPIFFIITTGSIFQSLSNILYCDAPGFPGAYESFCSLWLFNFPIQL